MTAADWIDNLERKAKAATPGPWSADGYGSGQQVTGATGTIFADTLAFHEDAEFIAAADPDTVLSLIDENRNLRHTTKADLKYLRRLEARLAAVEALADVTERAGDPLLRLDQLRAALSTAPTNTTKEN